MKIVKKGIPPSELIWRGTCYSCKSVVEAKRSELKVQTCQKDGTWGNAVCPVCAANMTFHPVEENKTKYFVRDD